MKKAYIVITLIIILMAGLGAYYYFNLYSKEIDLVDKQADYTVTPKQITDEFLRTPHFANRKYISKVVVVQGMVNEIHGNQIIVDNKIICTLKTPNPKIHANQLIVIKGRVLEFDDFMKELKLDNCFKM